MGGRATGQVVRRGLLAPAAGAQPAAGQAHRRHRGPHLELPARRRRGDHGRQGHRDPLPRRPDHVIGGRLPPCRRADRRRQAGDRRPGDQDRRGQGRAAAGGGVQLRRARGPRLPGRRDRVHGHPDQRDHAAGDQRRHRQRAQHRQRRGRVDRTGHRPSRAGDRPAARLRVRRRRAAARHRPARARDPAAHLPLAGAGAHPADHGDHRLLGRQRPDQGPRRRRHAGDLDLDIAAAGVDVRRGHRLLPAARGEIRGGAPHPRGQTRRDQDRDPARGAGDHRQRLHGDARDARPARRRARFDAHGRPGQRDRHPDRHGRVADAAAGDPRDRRPPRLLAEQARGVRPDERARRGARGRRHALGAARPARHPPPVADDRRRS